MFMFGTQSDAGLTVPAMEGYSIYGGDVVALEEAMVDMLGVIESIHTHDMAELQLKKEVATLEGSYASADEIASVKENYAVVMESAIKDMYDRMIAMLKNLWAKIKGYFKNMVRFFDGLVKSGKDFVKKYEKELYALDLTGYEYKMFKWDDAKLTASTDVAGYPTKVSSAIESVSRDAKTLVDKKEDILNKIRGSFVGKSSVDASDFAETLFGFFRNGASNRDDRTDVKVEISKIISTLKEDKMVAALKKAETETDKAFSKQISELTKLQNSLNKQVNGTSEGQAAKTEANRVSKKISIFQEGQSIGLAFVRAWKDAVVARNKEYKAVAVAAFRYKADK